MGNFYTKLMPYILSVMVLQLHDSTSYLSPFYTKPASLFTKLYPVKPSNCIISISLVLHINESKSYKTKCHEIKPKEFN